MIPGIGRYAQPVPRCASVTTDQSGVDGTLERRESIPDQRQEPFSRQSVEGLLGIVEVVNVDGLDAEVRSAALDLILKELCRKTMATGDDVCGIHDAAQEILLIEKASIILAGRRRILVERNVAALGTDHHVLSFDRRPDDFLQSCTKRPLRPLTSVIDRCIE